MLSSRKSLDQSTLPERVSRYESKVVLYGYLSHNIPPGMFYDYLSPNTMLGARALQEG
jgi:hypothetical protein